MVEYRGQWKVQVTGKDSDWPQRIVITGDTGRIEIPGLVGIVEIVDGDRWNLDIQHDDGSGWSGNDVVQAGPMSFGDLAMTHFVNTKDETRPGDPEPNDLTVRMDKVGPAFEVTSRPFAVDASAMTMLGDGVISNVQGQQLVGVSVRNTWGTAFSQGRFALDVSPLGRATLATFGVVVEDAWPPTVLAATGQVMRGPAVEIPQLDVGEEHLVFFLVDSSAAHRGKPELEFVLESSVYDPDPASSQHYNRRQVYIAEMTYDSLTGTTSVVVPEGRMTLTLEAITVDRRRLGTLCRDVERAVRESGDPRSGDLLRRLRSRRLDERTCRELAELVARTLCRCACGCGPDGDGPGHPTGPGPGGWPHVCLPGGLWLPLRFRYDVEVEGGFEGQHGPLMFEDPWWKVALLILAVLAWLVGLIASIVADKTGWGNHGDLPSKIGTVGESNRVTTDAALIELDGSRPAVQDVADAIPGETNASPIIGLGTVIPIDPQVATPLASAPDVIGHHVYKSGSRTGLTHGIITSVGTFTQCRGDFDEATGTCTPDPAHPDLELENQYSVGADPAFGEELFDDHGDSGSIVLSREATTMHQVVALLHSGGGGSSPIQDVLGSLDLRLR